MKTARTALTATLTTTVAAILALSAAPFAAAKSPVSTDAHTARIHSYVLLDRTGSMESRWSEALSSVNAYADELGSLDGGPKIDAEITLAAFDSMDGLKFDVLRSDIDPAHWKKVTDADATPRGTTPLYDAIGRIVALAEQDRPEKAVLVIMTDGEENASRELTRDGARAALDRARAKGWEVVFLGAEFSDFNDAVGVGQTTSRNMAATKGQLKDSMNRLARKSKDYATGAAPTVEWNAEDRKAAQEDQVKQQQNQR